MNDTLAYEPPVIRDYGSEPESAGDDECWGSEDETASS